MLIPKTIEEPNKQAKRKLDTQVVLHKRSKHASQDVMQDDFAKLHIQPHPLQEPSVQQCDIPETTLIVEEKVNNIQRSFIHVKHQARMKGVQFEPQLNIVKVMESSNSSEVEEAG